MPLTQPSDNPQWADHRPDFSCASYAHGPGVARVVLSGELDMATASELGDELAEAASGNMAVIVDLSDLTFMDSSGLHAIITAHARAAETHCRMVLIQGGRQVQRIFELTGVGRRLEFVSERDTRGLAAVRY